MNPFKNVNSPGLRPSSLNERGIVIQQSEPSLVKGGRGELTPNDTGYETRRQDLKPEVRDYADKLYAEIQAFYGAYGANNAADLYARAKAGKVKVPKENAKELLRLLDALGLALDKNELPPDAQELPPPEAFESLVAHLEASGKKVTALDEWEKYELIGGKLNGRVRVGGRWLPAINGELVGEIGGREIAGCRDVRNVGGKLNGEIKVGGRWLPAINGELVGEIGGREIAGCRDVRNVGGKLNGRVEVGGRDLPAINGELVGEIGGREIEHCDDVRNVGGSLCGQVAIKRPDGGKEDHRVVLGKIVE